MRTRERTLHPAWAQAACWAAALCLLAAAGCESSDDDDVDHTPPAGMGSLVVDNDTDNHIGVYVDGVAQATAREDKQTVYDLEPGERRVALEEQGGDRFEGLTVDILEGRLTRLDVSIDAADAEGYDVFVSLD